MSHQSSRSLSIDSLAEGLREGSRDSSELFDDSSESIGSIEFTLSSLSTFAPSEPRGNNSNNNPHYSTSSSVNGSITEDHSLLQFDGLVNTSINNLNMTGDNFVRDPAIVTEENISQMKQKLMEHFEHMRIVDLTRDHELLPNVLQEIYTFNRDFLGFNFEGTAKDRHIQDSFVFLASQRTLEESQHNLLIGHWMRELHNGNILALSEASFFVYMNSSPLTKGSVPALFSEFVAIFVE